MILRYNGKAGRNLAIGRLYHVALDKIRYVDDGPSVRIPVVDLTTRKAWLMPYKDMVSFCDDWTTDKRSV